MGNIIISDPQVTVNDDLWLVKANNFTVIKGEGENSVTGLSSGGAQNAISISQNTETKFSQIKFEVPSDTTHITKVGIAKQRFNANTVQVSGRDRKTGEQIVFVMSNAVITNNPEINLVQDGSISIEWAGDPIP